MSNKRPAFVYGIVAEKLSDSCISIGKRFSHLLRVNESAVAASHNREVKNAPVSKDKSRTLAHRDGSTKIGEKDSAEGALLPQKEKVEEEVEEISSSACSRHGEVYVLPNQVCIISSSFLAKKGVLPSQIRQVRYNPTLVLREVIFFSIAYLRVNSYPFPFTFAPIGKSAQRQE
jgi:hypothetical protein